MTRLTASAATLVAALGLTAAALTPAVAAPAPAPAPRAASASIVVDYNMDAHAVLATPDEVTVQVGDVVRVINKLSEGPSDGIYVALVNGSGQARVGATECTTATACKVGDDFPNNPALNVTAVAVGTVKIFRYNSMESPRPTYLGRIVIENNKSITITGSRGTVNGKPGVVVDGDTVGFAAGAELVAFIRFPGQTEYTEGAVHATVLLDGSFTWARKTGKKTYIYFKSANGEIMSNRVIIPAM